MIDLSRLSPWHQSRLARAVSKRASRAEKYWLAPWKLLDNPDPWQRELLCQMVTDRANIQALCARQLGKTTVVSSGAYLIACLGGFVLVVAPSDKQAILFHQALIDHHRRLHLCDVHGEPTQHGAKFEGGGRILVVPSSEKTVRGISAVDLLVAEEASRIPNELYGAASAMLATTGGQTVMLSTPFGQRGFFYDEWVHPEAKKHWKQHKVTWHKCPRISQEFIEAQRRQHGDLWIKQEFECEFLNASGTAVFGSVDGLIGDYDDEPIW